MHTRKPKRQPQVADIDEIAGVTDAEFAAINATLDAELTNAELEAAVHSPVRGLRDPDSHAPPATRTRHTTIRIPADVLNAYRVAAGQRGIGYQTLIIDVLRQHTAKLNTPDSD
jgi:uncharacterized protein (DUF4415 family)